MNIESIDTANMCSHLQKKLFEEDGIYHHLWIAMRDDPELTAVVRSRQLHIYRNGKTASHLPQWEEGADTGWEGCSEGHQRRQTM